MRQLRWQIEAEQKSKKWEIERQTSHLLWEVVSVKKIKKNALQTMSYTIISTNS